MDTYVNILDTFYQLIYKVTNELYKFSKNSESLHIRYFVIEEFFGYYLYIVDIKETSFEIVYSTG